MKYSQITNNSRRLFPELGTLINVSNLCVDFKFNSKSFLEHLFVQEANFCVFKRLNVVSNNTRSLLDKLFVGYQPVSKKFLAINSIEIIDTGNSGIMDSIMDNPKRFLNFIEYSRLFISDESRFEVNQLLKKYTFPNVYN